MIDKRQFVRLVLKHFDYLINNYYFTYIGFNELGRDDVLIFTKPNHIIEIKYNYPNKYFDINIYKKTNSILPYYWDNINLNWIEINYTEPNSQKLTEMPQNSLEKTIEHKALLLKKYGDKLLSGKEWFSWKDVSGWGK